MSETTVELSGLNDLFLFTNLFTGTRPATEIPGFPQTDTDIAQSKIAERDAKNINKDIPFQEILGQQIINLTVHDVPDLQKSSHPAIESSTSKLIQDDCNGEADVYNIQRTLVSGNQQGNANNLTMIPAFFERKIDGFTSLTKKGEREFDPNLSGLQISGTPHYADILTGTLIEHSETAFRNSGQKLSLKSNIVIESSSKNIHTFIPAANRGNFFLSPYPERKLTETDIQKKVTFQSHLNLPPLTGRKADSLSGHILLPLEGKWIREDNILQNPAEMQKSAQSISVTIQEPEFMNSGKIIDIKELPAAFRSQAQNISTENRFHVPVPERNNQINITEKHLENDLAKVVNKVSPLHNVQGTLQVNEEWNLFDNFKQKHNFSMSVSPEIHMQKTHNGYSFLQDTQIITDDILSTSTTTNFSQNQNTELFPLSGTTQPLLLEGRNDDVSHALHRNFTSGIEHSHNIMEQLFQKISMINQGDKSEIRMHLTPPELGSVKIHFTEENEEIEAKIFVENAEVKAAIEGNVHRLKESVAASGVEIHKFEVYVQNSNEDKEKSSENSEPGNPHYTQKSQDSQNDDQSGNERNVNNSLQIETVINTPDLMVDYII
ncbi:MAG: flagellar hook-length control protein FliK [Candidatus Brocadia sp.]|jgi:flagellar hook-length control protein FliK